MKTLLLTTLLALPCAVFAQDAPGDGKPKKPKKDPAVIFEVMDKDKDGKVSKVEFMANKKGEWAAQGEKAFAGKDKDGDGFLTLEEFTAKRQN